MLSFFTSGSWEKDTIFGAARKNFGSSYFVTALAQTSAHYWYIPIKVLFTSDNSFWRGWERPDEKIIFMSNQNKLSDVNKTYINISNEQKFKLIFFYIIFLFIDLLLNTCPFQFEYKYHNFGLLSFVGFQNVHHWKT